jgi:flagellar basal body rod protein FlgG
MEQSNVSGATEILGLMSTLRSAEAGQHIVQLYDDLMAQAAQGLGQIQG